MDSSLLAHADLLMVAADLLRDPREVELPSRDEIEQLIQAADLGERAECHPLLDAVCVASEAAIAERSNEYHRLFEGAAACPINEAAYVRRDKGSLLADISGFYLAFGVKPSPERGERPDHLRAEIEFLAVLLVLAAQARQRGASEDEGVTFDALRSFVEDHLGVWLPSFCTRLRESSCGAGYPAAARALKGVFAAIAACHGLCVSDANADILPEMDAEEPSSDCGTIPGVLPLCTLTIGGADEPSDVTKEPS